MLEEITLLDTYEVYVTDHSDDDDMTFDLDKLYDDLEGNSSNPIDTSLPEVIEEDDSCPGGACKL